MEGLIIWIVIIVGWAVIKGLSGPSEEEQIEARRELFDKIKFQIQVNEEIPPKDRGLPQVKCLAVKIKGLFGHPTENQTKLILTIHDNSDTSDEEFGPPVLCSYSVFAEKNSRVFGINVTWNSTPDTYLPNWYDWIYIPKELILPPYKGKRRLKFNLTACDTDTEVVHAGYDDLTKIKHNCSTFFNFSTKEIGYLEEFVNKSKVEDLTIKLAMTMAATDGHLDQKELNVIKNWAKSLTLELDADKQEEKKKHFSKYIKESYKEAKDKKISITKLVKEFNDKASKGQKYLAIELMLNVASSDDKLAKEEEQFINKIAKTTGIDIKTFKDMKNKIVAKVGKVDLSEKPSEESFGISDDMNKSEKCKILRKEYTKWNSQTTQKDLKRKKRAKEMVKAIATLRKKYNC